MAENYSADGISNEAPSPEVEAQVAGYREKLNTMLKGGGTTAAPTRMTGAPPAYMGAARRAYEASQRKSEESRTTTTPGAAKVAAEQALSPAEQRLKKANENPALWDPKHKDHEAARKELREAVAAAATPEEQQAMRDAPLEAHRSAFGLQPPDLPPMALAAYEESFSDWERDFLIDARAAGVPSDLVRALRDEGIRLGMQVDGKPLSDEVVDGVLKKYAGRLTATQAKALKAYWRRIEGGGSA